MNRDVQDYVHMVKALWSGTYLCPYVLSKIQLGSERCIQQLLIKHVK